MQKILVMPRECLHGLDGFVAWSQASKLVDSAASSVRWLPRAEAECSEKWVQPIPCVMFRNSAGRYCIFRQARQSRLDLSRKLSLIIGGHVDFDFNDLGIQEIFEATARKEVTEELGITLDNQLHPIGVVIDSSSLLASRHFGVIYETVIDGNIKSDAADEFVVGSEYNGQFFDLESLSKLMIFQRPRLRFDPWSFLVFSQYLGRDFSRNLGHQPMLNLPTE